MPHPYQAYGKVVTRMEKELLAGIKPQGLAKMVIARRDEQWVSMEELTDYGLHRALLHLLEDMQLILVTQHSTSPMLKLTAKGLQLVIKHVRGAL